MNTIKLFISIRNENTNTIDENLMYNKLIIRINKEFKISKLLKKIDEEYMSLFKLKNLHITTKLLDNYGYSLSNNCIVGDLLKEGDYITAVMDDEIIVNEEDKQSLNEIYENNFFIIRHFVEKLENSSLKKEEINENYVINVLNFGLFDDWDLKFNIAKFLKKWLLNNKIKNENKINRIIYLIINKFLDSNDFNLITIVINIIEILSNFPYIIKEFSNKKFIGKMLYLAQKNIKFSNFKGRISKIITFLNKSNFLTNKGLLYKIEDEINNKENINNRIKNKNNNHNFENKNNKNLNKNKDRIDELRLKKLYDKDEELKEIYDKDEEFKISPFYYNKNNEKYNNSNIHDFTENIYKKDSNNKKYVNYNNDYKETLNKYNDKIDDFDLNNNSNYYNDKRQNKINENSFKKNNNKKDIFYDSLDQFQTNNYSKNNSDIDEFLSLINPLNEQNLIEFGLENIKDILHQKPYISNLKIYMKLMKIFSCDINKTSEKSFNQIVEILTLNLNDNQAEFLIKKNFIMVLLQSYNINNPSCKFFIKNFIEAILKQKGDKIDIINILTILSSNDKDLKKIAIESFLQLSDPNNKTFKGFCIQIEAYLKDFLNLIINEKDDYILEKLLQCLSNLCLNETLQSELIHLNVIDLLLLNLRCEEIYKQRLSSKCLLNLCSKNVKYKLKILPELERELELLKNNELDRIVKSYILSILEN